MLKLSSWVIYLCILGINISIFPQIPGYKDIFKVYFEHDFEDNTVGDYLNSEWKEDWNYPEWSDRQIPPEILLNGDVENGTKVMRWNFPEGSVGPSEGGGQWLTPLYSSYNELYFSYRVKFKPGFEWVLGGKLPGVIGGPQWEGYDPPGWSDGFVAKPTWNRYSQIVFYYYHQDQDHTYGNSKGWDYYVESDIWYTITFRIVMNTLNEIDGNNDGILEGFINDKLFCQITDLRFRNLNSIGIDHLHITSFFGGDTEEWAAQRDEWIDLDDFVVFTYKD